MEKLKNHNVLVLGGAGEVGEGIVSAIVREGGSAIVASRSAEKLQTLKLRLKSEANADHILTIEADPTTDSGRDLILKFIEKRGKLNHVISSFGGWYQGPTLLETSDDDFQKVLKNGVLAHFKAAKNFLPLLKSSEDRFIFINGLASQFPIPKSMPLSVSAAAQAMLIRGFAAEASDSSPIIGSLMIMNQVSTRSLPGTPDTFLSLDEIGSAILQALRAEKTASHLQIAKNQGRVSIATSAT